MIPNNSPWLHQLKRTRPVVPLSTDEKSDVAIVGGGIAGVVTAFFTLRDTDHRVILLEADKVAHGATGHNAGQITSYFERPFSDLVKEFGIEQAAAGQRAVESAWGLLEEIVTDARLQTPLYTFTGYAGCTTYEQVIAHLSNNHYRAQGELLTETILIATEWITDHPIPDEYAELYATVPQVDILSLMESDNPDYIAVLGYKKGCMNSALFSEEVVGYLLATYPERFMLYEGSPVQTVTLGKNEGILMAGKHTLTATRIILCTNGFENFTIRNEAGKDINTAFHHTVQGRIGYMAGYVEPLDHPPIAISYFSKNREKTGDPTGEMYFLLTRRPHEHEGTGTHNLVCVAGPEKVLPNLAIYSREDTCSEDTRDIMDAFLQANYRHYPRAGAHYAFCWHGLMGYTPNKVRRVGYEPRNPVLLYNLGCNGVGILPSVYGGKRIAQLLNGEELEPSIFDPHDQQDEYLC